MHVKHVYRPTVREALAEARELLGPHALVLSTELVPAAGWRGWVGQRVVRLTAAAERPAPAEPETPVSEDRPPVSAVRSSAPLSGPRQGVAARLVAVGFDPILAEAIVARMTDSECRLASEATIRRAVASEVGAMAAAADEARYEIFIGPPGVGKTTTIAKIAAQARATGNRTTSLVAADAFRAGAVEQLRSYAEIVRSPFRVARSPEELDQALRASRHHTLIDTAGTSRGETRLGDLLEALGRRRRHLRTHLVLAGDTSPATTRRILDRYAPLKPSRVVLTKLDESESLMPLLGVIRASGLPVSYLTAGQRVPDDLWRATPANLAAALLGEPTPEVLACP